MPSELSYFILNYGYLAIFLLIFSQEIGIPNPIPNELVLVYSGYLCSIGLFQFLWVIFTAISADFLGTNILYFVFYFFGNNILQRKPKWLPISQKSINRASERVSKGGLWAIYVGRVIPFIRGYTSIIAGVLQIKPKRFLLIALISALCWSGIFVSIGKLIGNNWSVFAVYLVNIKYIILSLVVLFITFLIIRYYRKREDFKSSN